MIIKTRFSKIIFGTVLTSAVGILPLFSFGGGFTVNQIRILGLEHVPAATVYHYLPVQKGSYFGDVQSAEIIKKLYQSGFFSSVKISRQQNNLVIQVVERQTIARVIIEGNKDIKTEKLQEALKKLNFYEGMPFRPEILENIRQDLLTQYNTRGKYAADVETTVTDLANKRVSVRIKIIEGKPAKIRSILIIGAHAFSERTLSHQLSLGRSSTLSWFTGSDKYTKEKLETSLDNLRAYYLDRGYLKMRVIDSKVVFTVDKKLASIVISIEEGPRYKVSGYSFTGKTILSEEALRHLVPFKSGDIFSRKLLLQAEDAIAVALGDKGYSLTAIQVQPRFDEAQQTVFLTFLIEPGVPTYVRRINFIGNQDTADYVLRNAMRQQEGALLNVSKVRESERELRVTRFFQDVVVKVAPVEGVPDQVDLNVSVKEQRSSELRLSGGYGTNGFVVMAGLNQPNFLGTGRSLGLNFSHDDLGEYYSADYYDPFYLPNGVGRGFSAYYQRMRQNKRVIIAKYAADRVGGELSYHFPIGEKTFFNVGGGLDAIHILPFRTFTPAPEYQNFINLFGTHITQVHLSSSIDYQDYDKLPMPTQGGHYNLGAMVGLPIEKKNNISTVKYYKLSFEGQYYQPLVAGFILSGHTNLAYGNSFSRKFGLPFHENYFAGGNAAGKVRGFEDYTLGPKDTGAGDPLGGNVLLSGSLELILPNFGYESIRVSSFLDAGNAYSWNVSRAWNLSGTDAGRLRFSTGVAVDWQSPFGAVGFSLGFPIKKYSGDRKEVFQFSFSSAF